MVHYKRVEGPPKPEVDVTKNEMSENVQLSWEEEVLRRIAPRLAEVQRCAAQDDEVLGWEAAGVRRLAQETGDPY